MMYKIIFLVFCVVLSWNKVHGNAEDKVAIMSAMRPIVEECAKKHGVTFEALLAAKASGKIDGIEPCFYGCVYKKTDFLNSKGEYDVDNALAKLKKYISTDDDYAKLSQVGKDCASVNAKPVGDGEAGCERGVLLTQCFLDHKGVVPM